MVYSPFRPHSLPLLHLFPTLPSARIPLSLEVGPLHPARGLRERCKLPSGPGQSPAAKRYLVHFGLKNAYESNFKSTFTKMFVFSLFASNNATLLGEAQIGQHITQCNIMLHFVTVCTIYYLLLPCHCYQVTALTAVSL